MYKLTSLQAARGFAALFVVAFHSLFINEKYVQGESLLPEMLVFGQTGVDLFFVISGFVMIIAFRNKFGVRGEVFNFLKGRFFRIYPIYWVYLLAVFLVFTLKPEMVNSSQGGGVDLFSSFTLTPHDSPPLVMVAWSLVHEVWFYLVFAVILMLPAKWMTHAFVAWLTVILSASVFAETPENAYLRIMTHEFSIEFIFGALAGITYLNASKIKSSFTVPLLLLIGMGGIAYALSSELIGNADVIQSISLERVFAVGGSYTLLLLALTLQESTGKMKCFGFLRSAGDMSYSLYLSHVLTLSLCGRVWMMLGFSGGGFWSAVIFWVVSYTAVLVVAYASYHLIERNLIRLTGKIQFPVIRRSVS